LRPFEPHLEVRQTLAASAIHLSLWPVPSSLSPSLCTLPVDSALLSGAMLCVDLLCWLWPLLDDASIGTLWVTSRTSLLLLLSILKRDIGGLWWWCENCRCLMQSRTCVHCLDLGNLKLAHTQPNALFIVAPAMCRASRPLWLGWLTKMVLDQLKALRSVRMLSRG
jgi:hypothetical protein